MVDEKEFFREATLRICGELEIEAGLKSLFDYLREHLPADKLYLQRYYRDLGAMRFVARADVSGGERIDALLPVPEVAQNAIEDFDSRWMSGESPTAVTFNKSLEHPLSRAMLLALGEPPSSALALPLNVKGVFAGTLALLAVGDDRFNETHAHLFATLKEPTFIALSNHLKHEEVVRLKDRLADDNQFLNREILRLHGDKIVGADFGLRTVMSHVRQVAPTESPVLVTGETGVGKDIIANAIHLGSTRREGPFIPVNCGAIPDSLIDSELFGHERGAFTGALSRKRGRFERAHRGTIFLDEIGDMPLEAQVRLLRVLQHREVERIGGTDPIPVDIRIIAATNQDLGEMVRQGRFREDLWFRLNVFPIHVPSLRERAGDIPALVRHFLELKAGELKIGDIPVLAPGEMDRLVAYPWPGNVRELENVVERAMILYWGKPLRFDDLGGRSGSTDGGTSPQGAPASLALDDVMRSHIQRVLGMTGGKIHGPGGAGEVLDVNPSTLRNRMEKLGIDFKR